METFRRGDVVGRKSYNTDIYFKIKDFYQDDAGRAVLYWPWFRWE